MKTSHVNQPDDARDTTPLPSENDVCPHEELSSQEIAEITQMMRDLQEKDVERQHRFGLVRPVIQTEYKGHRLVAVGGEIHVIPVYESFLQFLDYYAAQVLDKSFWEQEYAKPVKDRHRIVKWRDHLIETTNEQRADPPAGGPMYDGWSVAYLHLAYDLYALQHHQTLQQSVLKRLRIPDQFQGARYELFVTATMIRAGFHMEHTDGKGTMTSSPEFIATHLATGQRLAVEAKSRHRPGVMGQVGAIQDAETLSVGVRRLVRDAAKKHVTDPYLIFVDTNLPPEFGYSDGDRWSAEIEEELGELDSSWGEFTPMNVIIVTNTPHDYGSPRSVDPPGIAYAMTSIAPRYVLEHPEVIPNILRAIEQYAQIPRRFEEAE